MCCVGTCPSFRLWEVKVELYVAAVSAVVTLVLVVLTSGAGLKYKQGKEKAGALQSQNLLAHRLK